MTLALGIDHGTATTGFGLGQQLPDGELRAVDFGVITTPKDASAPDRLVLLYRKLTDLLLLHRPQTRGGEAFFQKNAALASGRRAV
jgi:crossover junction endodeoxyribonuclease RuvC